MNSHKIIGYSLLFAGLALIIFPLYQSYVVFTGKAKVSEVFRVTVTVSSQKTGTVPGNIQDVQNPLNAEISKQISQMIPVDAFTKMLNLLVWFMLATILIFGGTQIASLGVKLIK